MKTKLLFLTALLAVTAVGQNFDTLPSINGASVSLTDKIMIRDASVPAANGALFQMTLGEVLNIPGMFNTREPALGNPAANGWLLSSTTAGTRSWVPPPSSATWGSISGTLASQTDLNSALAGKQATLVSATNIKTVNGTSLLGAGDLTVSATPTNGELNTAIATNRLATRATITGADAAFNFVIVGDSIMAGTSSGGATSPNYLANILPNKSYFSGRATVINRGLSGRQTGQLITDYTTGTNTDCYSFRPSNQAGKRCVVFVTCGINDYKDGLSMVTALANMKSYVQTLKNDGFEVWLGIPLPMKALGLTDYNCRTAMASFISGLTAWDVPDKKVNFWTLVRTLDPAASGVNWSTDGLHPNNALYQTMADLINSTAWSDDQKYGGLELGSLAFQNADLTQFNGEANFYGDIKREAYTGTRGGIKLQVVAAGNNRQVRIDHAQTPSGDSPANSKVTSIFNGTSWTETSISQEGTYSGNGIRLLPRTVATLPANPSSNLFATVSDAASFSAGTAVTGGGSTKCLVQHTGSQWVMVMQLY